MCSFTPTKIREYIFSVPLQVASISEPMKEKIGFFNPGSGTLIRDREEKIFQKYDIRVVGGGNDGDLSIKPTDIDFSTVTVGFNKVLSFTLNNKSKTNIFVEFSLEQVGIDEENRTEKD